MTDEKAPAPDAAGPAPEPHETVLAVTPVQIARFLLVVVVSLIVVGLATQLYVELLDGPPLRRLADRFDLDEEITVPTWYATVSLLFCASLIGIIGCAVRQQGGPYVRSWFGLAVIFALISIDEGASFHELSMRELRSAFDLPDYLHFAWVIPGSLVVITFVAIYFRFWWHLPPRSRWAFAVAAFLFVGGAIGFEIFGGYLTKTEGQHTLAFQLVATAEESLEMLGVLVFIWALLSHLADISGSVRFSLATHTRALAHSRASAPAEERAKRLTPQAIMALTGSWLLTAGRAVVIAMLGVSLAVFIVPAGLSAWERSTGGNISVDEAIRVYLCIAFGLAMIFAWVWRWPTWVTGLRFAWLTLAGMYVLLLCICVFDPLPLRQEASWIRYATAGVLFAASIAAFCIWLSPRKFGPPRDIGEAVFWAVVGAAFLFAGFDELAEFHEALGLAIQRSDLVSGFDQDSVSVVYAVGGLVAMLVAWRVLRDGLFATFPWVCGGYLGAAVVYAISQLGDSLDEATMRALGPFARELVVTGYRFPDIWFVLYHPADLLNATEEVLELTAAALLLAVTARMLMVQLGPPESQLTNPARETSRLRANVWRAAFGGTVLVLVGISASATMLVSPVLPSADIELAEAWDSSSADVGLGGKLDTFLPRLVFANGASINLERSARSLVLREADNTLIRRIHLRRMLTDATGVALNTGGQLLVLTDDDDGDSFLPRMRWATGLVVKVEENQLALLPTKHDMGGVAQDTVRADTQLDAQTSADPTTALVVTYAAGRLSRKEFVRALVARPRTPVTDVLRGTIARTVLLKRRSSPYIIDDLVIAPQGALVVMEGVDIRLRQDATVRIHGGFYVLGTADLPVSFAGPAGGFYSKISVHGNSAEISHASFANGSTLLSIVNTAHHRMEIDNSRFERWNRFALEIRGAEAVRVSRSQFGIDTPVNKIRGETIRGRSSRVHIEQSVFGLRRGYADVIDLDTCPPGQTSIIESNRFLGGEDEAIDLEDCSALVLSNHFTNFLASTEAVGEGANGGAISATGKSRVVVANNIIVHSFHGVGVRDGAEALLVHNTIASSNIAVTVYASEDKLPGGRAYLFNNILWNNRDWHTMEPQDIVLNGAWWDDYSPREAGTIEGDHNIFGAAWSGMDNLVANPDLVWTNGIPRPSESSAARGSALVVVPELREFDSEAVARALASDFFGRKRGR